MPDILARQRTIIGTTAEWAAHDLVIGQGEIALERVSAALIKAKVGDGLTTFAALPYTNADKADAGSVTGLVPMARSITTTGGLTGGGDLTANRTLAIAATSNGYGTRHVGTVPPTPADGADGDIWYVV